MSASWEIREGDARERLAELPDGSVHCCVTSPPYFGLRDYGVDGQIGLEATPDEYVAEIVEVFRGVRRVLRDDGTVWLNLGDSYAGSWGAQSRGETSALRDRGISEAQIVAHPKGQTRTGSIPAGAPYKPKDLIGIPWMVAFALRADGWYLRSDIIWAKPNPMPESVTDRPTRAHEYIFLLSKSRTYFYTADAIREPHAEVSLARMDRGRSDDHKYADGGPGGQTLAADITQACHPNGRNKRSVWTVSTKPYSGAHFATFPPDLIEPCILAGCPKGGTVLDPFAGAGTTGMVALRYSRSFIGIELNPEYAQMARNRIRDDAPLLNTVAEAA